MRLLVCLAVLLALTGPALASKGDNGMTTYDGRKRAPNTVVFGNQLIMDLTWESTLGFLADLAKGTYKPVANAPATEKKEVRLRTIVLLFLQMQPAKHPQQQHKVTAGAATAHALSPSY